MRFLHTIIGCLLLASSLNTSVLAATGDLIEEGVSLNIVITGPSDVQVGRTVVLDASDTSGLGENTTYRWYRGASPQPISNTVEAVYTPEKPGLETIRLVVKSTIDGEVVEQETQRVLTVFERKIVMIADSTTPAEKLAIHQQAAANAGVYLQVLQPRSSGIPIADEDSLFNVISDQIDVLVGAESIILWKEGISGLQAFRRAIEEDAERLQALQNQTIVLITDGSLKTLARTAQGPFAALKPQQILVTRKEAINPLFAATDTTILVSELEQRDIDVTVVNSASTRIRIWAPLSSLVNYMLSHGMSSQIVILLLILPFIATILAFLKQVVGITTFGLFTPSIVALSLLALGWQIGIAFLLFILITGYMTRSVMKKWRMLYIPKVAIILTVVSITLMILLAAATAFGLTFSRDTVFILLIMSTLAESFLNVKTNEGLYSAILGVGETLLAALLCVFIVQWSLLQSLVLAFPEIILLTILINAGLGKWTGLRLVEYFRFREVFKHIHEE